MKFMLLVHHDEAAFELLDKQQQEQMLAESVALTHGPASPKRKTRSIFACLKIDK